MKRFYTLFVGIDEVSIKKDPGLIPLNIADVEGYTSVIAGYHADFFQKSGIHPNIQFQKVGHFFSSELMNELIFVFLNAKKIDVLNMFHLRISTLLVLGLYKLLNSNGKTYLKLDADWSILRKQLFLVILHPTRFSDRFLSKIFRTTNVITVEDENLAREMTNLGVQVQYLPNGFDQEIFGHQSAMQNRLAGQKIDFLHVSRIGTEQKDTETLLDAWILFKQKFDLENIARLKMVGSVEEAFIEKIKIYTEVHPQAMKSVDFLGPQPAENVSAMMASSQYFVLTSRFESFGLVYVEAMASALPIISSKLPVLESILGPYIAKHSMMFEIGNVEKLSVIFADAIKKYNSDWYRDMSSAEMKRAKQQFEWPTIAKRLIDFLDRSDK